MLRLHVDVEFATKWAAVGQECLCLIKRGLPETERPLAEMLRCQRTVGKACYRSIPSERVKASSMSTPRYRTVLSVFVCPRSNWTARRLPVF